MNENNIEELQDRISKLEIKLESLNSQYLEAEKLGKETGIARILRQNINKNNQELDELNKDKKQIVDKLLQESEELEDEIKELEDEIKELESEIRYFEKLISRDKQNNVSNEDAIQKNRILKLEKLKTKSSEKTKSLVEKRDRITIVNLNLDILGIEKEEINNNEKDDKNINENIEEFKMQDPKYRAKKIGEQILADMAMKNNIKEKVKNIHLKNKNPEINKEVMKFNAPKSNFVKGREPEKLYQKGEELPQEQVEGLNIKENSRKIINQPKNIKEEKAEGLLSKIKKLKFIKIIIDFFSKIKNNENRLPEGTRNKEDSKTISEIIKESNERVKQIEEKEQFIPKVHINHEQAVQNVIDNSAKTTEEQKEK